MRQTAKPALVVLDLDASRALAVGAGQVFALPLALSLEGRQVDVGQAGLDLCRRSPHLACLGFLPHLGTSRIWSAGKHRLDANQALAAALARLQPVCGPSTGVLIAVPPYLEDAQVDQILKMAGQARWPVLGTVPSPLAAAQAAHARQVWSGLAIVVEADEHALTLSAVLNTDGEARLLGSQALARLGLRAWKERLLDVVADRCVRLSRRDPRDSGDAEQGLYDQFDAAFDAARAGRMAEVVAQTKTWSQHLMLPAEDLRGMCSRLVEQALDGADAFRASLSAPLGTLVLSETAARLPGLVDALEAALLLPAPVRIAEPASDFGEGLLQEGDAGPRQVCVLPGDAAARAALEIAARLACQGGPAGPVDAAPLPDPAPPEEGPLRVRSNHQDHPVALRPFTLGRHPSCDLVFDSERFPNVSARHCEIVPGRRAAVLRDHSRNGTYVNDRAVVGELILTSGDWIRLGPNGPLVRLLGTPAEPRRHTTTA
jgi:hypothetical protein